MESQFKCEECDGNEYYIESGFYYCKECHTQAQEFREAIFESQEATRGLTGSRLSKKKENKRKKEGKISTYETYNYILLGLVNEVIAAGARKELRGVVKTLWFKYLEKLKVIGDGLPMLSAVYPNLDAEVFYGRNKKKRSRKSSTSDSDTGSTSRIKRKRDFLKSDYEQEASLLTPDANSSANQSLSSLKGSSETDFETKLRFNKAAITEMLKKHSASSVYRHYKTGEEPKKMTTRSVSTAYKNSPKMITRNKLYCLIYLGLLIIKDKIQLGDLLRWIREGTVSYNSVMHFFPEELQEENSVDLSHFVARKMPITNFFTRQTTAEMAKFLDSTKQIPIQNLVDLCERYCKELNLPEEIYKCSLKLMLQSAPHMEISKKITIIPNYEARAISFIIFTLKLLFGLDGLTEYRFSKFATIVNHINQDSKLHIKKMFVFDKWMKHIKYRRCVIKHHHFPTAFLNDNSISDVDLFGDFLEKNITKLNEDNDETLQADFEVYKKLLSDLKGKHSEETNIHFPPTLTPFRDYCDTILKTQNEYLPELKYNFTAKSIDFLLRPYSYLKLVNRGQPVEIKHRGANKNMKFVPLVNPHLNRYNKLRNRRKFVTVRIENDEVFPKQGDTRKEERNTTIGTKAALKAHCAEYHALHLKSLKKMKKLVVKELSEAENIVHRDEDVYDVHYNPHERFWVSCKYLDRFTEEESFNDYLQTLPYPFVFILEECARILEMDKKHVLQEYIYVELYLCHVAKFGRNTVHPVVFDKELKKLINKAKKEW